VQPLTRQLGEEPDARELVLGCGCAGTHAPVSGACVRGGAWGTGRFPS
jgi:hypothetical protein